MTTTPNPLPLCEAIVERLLHKSDPLRDSESAGMMHVSVAMQLVREGFAALSVEEVRLAILANLRWVPVGGDGAMGLEVTTSAQAVMQLLRKE